MKTDTSRITTSLLIVFCIIGLWRPKWISNNIYKYYSIIMIFVFSFLLTLTMLINLILLKDKEQLTDSMYMTLTELALFLKICNFHGHNRSIQSLLISVQNFQLETPQEIEIYQNKARFYFQILLMDFMFTNLSHVMIQLRALLSSEYIQPFPAWYPFDSGFSIRRYWLIYVHQLIGMTLTSNLNVSIELYPNFMLYMVSVQMEILCNRLRNIGHRSRKIGCNKVNYANVDGIEDQETALVALKKCVKTHQNILM